MDSEASAGNNRLISRQHAKLISRADEILEEFRFCRVTSKQPLLPLGQAQKVMKRKVFSDLEQKVLEQIENGTEEINDIHVESGISMNQLLGVILELELKGIVQQNNSSTYSIKEEIVLQ